MAADVDYSVRTEVAEDLCPQVGSANTVQPWVVAVAAVGTEPRVYDG